MDRFPSPDLPYSALITPRRPRQPRILAAALLWGAILLTGLLAGACLSQPEPAPDPYARYRPAVKPAEQGLFAELGSVPRYDIDISVSHELTQLQGTATIQVPNNSPEPWTYVVFRLYPTLEQYGGLLSLHSASVNGQPAPFSYLAQGTAARVDLPVALLSGQEMEVYLSWTLDIPHWDTDTPAAYRLFGLSQDMLNLPLFYPALAVYEPGPTLGTGRWWLEQGTVRGDAAFNYASLFVVTATLPSDEIPITSGTLVTSTLLGDGTSRHVWVTGPNREFLLQMGRGLQSDSLEAYNTRITSYWLPGQDGAGRAALQYASAALRIFSDKFGPYPYRDLRVAVAPLAFRGMEYPQAVQLGVELYDRFLDELEIRTVHEVAHQWWYLQVHNDPVNFPWIDEGLAEYSTKIYYEAMRGKEYADGLQARRWQGVIDNMERKGSDAPLNLPVTDYANGTQYEAVVYGKGALFYDAIHQTLGDRQFEAFLQDYVKKYRYNIVDPSKILTLLRTYNQPVADSLYQRWIGEIPVEMEAVTPTLESGAGEIGQSKIGE